MSSNLFSFINYLPLLALSLLVSGVDVSDNTPDTMVPGSSVTVTSTIAKGDIQGFAKLQLDVPSGLRISPLDTKGASFTFSEGKAKFIWMTLPEDGSFNISYSIGVDENASGKYSVTGIFSYIEDNNRVDYNLQSKTITVAGNISNALASEAPVKYDLPESQKLSATSQSSKGGFSRRSYRVITPLGNDRYSVQVFLTDIDFKGYAKIEERLPQGMSATCRVSSGAVVTLDKGIVKFVWFDIPQTNKVNVVYEVEGAGVQEIMGDFHYVEGVSPIKVAIETANDELPVALATEKPIEVKVSGIAVEPSVVNLPEKTDNGSEKNLSKEQPEYKDPVSVSIESKSNVAEADARSTELSGDITVNRQEMAANQKQVSSQKDISVSAQPERSERTSSIPNPDKGIVFKVQIAAGPNTVDKSYFTSRHSFAENFQIENHDGWVKYTTGSHSSYNDARGNRERIKERYNFDGPFVTAYNSGERITVQEALMIANQQWIP
jgi:hypothetical protein